MCIPWDMPRPDNSKAEICDSSGNHCFYSKMKNYTFSGELCKCYPNCNTVQYSYGERHSPIAIRRECEGIGQGFKYMARTRMSTTIIPFMSIVIKRLSENDPTNSPFDIYNELKPSPIIKQWCKETFRNDISILEVQIVGQSHTRMKQSLRHPLSSKIGQLGGTLGVFTGFSFMALVEIMYFIVLTFLDVISTLKNQYFS